MMSGECANLGGLGGGGLGGLGSGGLGGGGLGGLGGGGLGGGGLGGGGLGTCISMNLCSSNEYSWVVLVFLPDSMGWHYIKETYQADKLPTSMNPVRPTTVCLKFVDPMLCSSFY